MSFRIIISFLLIFVFFVSCSKDTVKKSTIKQTNLELQMIEAYNKGLEELDRQDAIYAARKFNEAELLYPQSTWAPKSALMAAYSYYIQDYYGDAIAELKRFLRVYPKYKDLDYVYYLLAISHYEQIVDEKKDLKSIINAKKYFELVVQNYANTEYAVDSNFKLDYINDILASKEMYIGRYYISKKISYNRKKFRFAGQRSL